MSIVVNGKVKEYKERMRAIDLIDASNKNIITCKVNNKLRDLSYYIDDNSRVDFLGLDDEDSIRVYDASLRFLFVMAAYEVNPKLVVNCDYYISRSVCFRVNDSSFSENEYEKIKNKMKEIVNNDYEFVRETIDKESAKKYYDSK